MGKVAVCVRVCVRACSHYCLVCVFVCVGGSVKRINQWDKSSIGTGSRTFEHSLMRQFQQTKDLGNELSSTLLHAQLCVARKCVLRLSPVSYVPSVDPNRCVYAVTAASTYSKPQDLPFPSTLLLLLLPPTAGCECLSWNCANSWLLCCSLLLLLYCCCFFFVAAKHKP